MQPSRKKTGVSDGFLEGYEQVLETQIVTYAPLHQLLVTVRMRENQRQGQRTLAVLQLLRVQGQCGDADGVQAAAEEDASPARRQASIDGAGERGVEFLDYVAGFPTQLALRRRIPVLRHPSRPAFDA